MCPIEILHLASKTYLGNDIHKVYWQRCRRRRFASKTGPFECCGTQILSSNLLLWIRNHKESPLSSSLLWLRVICCKFGRFIAVFRRASPGRVLKQPRNSRIRRLTLRLETRLSNTRVSLRIHTYSNPNQCIRDKSEPFSLEMLESIVLSRKHHGREVELGIGEFCNGTWWLFSDSCCWGNNSFIDWNI